MGIKIELDRERVVGAIALLENYLDGAVHDYENGDVDNSDFISDCIYVHKMLECVYNPFKSIVGDEYEKRFLAAKRKLNK